MLYQEADAIPLVRAVQKALGHEYTVKFNSCQNAFIISLKVEHGTHCKFIAVKFEEMNEAIATDAAQRMAKYLKTAFHDRPDAAILINGKVIY